MKRLTRRRPGGAVWYVDDVTGHKRPVHLMSVMDIIHAMNHLCELEDKIERGELVEPQPDEITILKKKYRLAVLVLQAISQRAGDSKSGGHDEWTEAKAFIDCRTAATMCLERLGEDTEMPNFKKGE